MGNILSLIPCCRQPPARGGTHVANAYKEDVYAKVRSDTKTKELVEVKTPIDVAGGSAANRGEMKSKWEIVDNNGFTKIAPGTSLNFDPVSGFQLYVSIMTTGNEEICNCYPVRRGRSVIVNAEGYIKETKEGKIWRDIDGNNYKN